MISVLGLLKLALFSGMFWDQITGRDDESSETLEHLLASLICFVQQWCELEEVLECNIHIFHEVLEKKSALFK